jgi:hypothetical protein
MQLGITSFLTDRSMAPADLAVACEERGFSSLYFPEHTHLPVRADTPPALVEGVHLDDYQRSLDPLVALATAASVTKRIRLGTGVLLVAQHHPILLAKQVATLDHLSAGRGAGKWRASTSFACRHSGPRNELPFMVSLYRSTNPGAGRNQLNNRVSPY